MLPEHYPVRIFPLPGGIRRDWKLSGKFPVVRVAIVGFVDFGLQLIRKRPVNPGERIGQERDTVLVLLEIAQSLLRDTEPEAGIELFNARKVC